MSKGHLSAWPTVPVGGWALSCDIGGGAVAVTIPAGTYEGVEDLLAELQTQLTTSMAATFTVSLGLTEATRTALVTIAKETGTFTVSWTSSALKNFLGFHDDFPISNDPSGTGIFHVDGIWTPDCECSAHYGSSDPGHYRYASSQTRSATGIVKSIVESSYREHPSITWSHVSAARARSARASGAAFEDWWRDTQMGNSSVFEVNAKVNWIPNSDSPATYYTYRLLWDGTSKMERAVQEWDGLWSITVRGIVV